MEVGVTLLGNYPLSNPYHELVFYARSCCPLFIFGAALLYMLPRPAAAPRWRREGTSRFAVLGHDPSHILFSLGCV